MSYLLYEVWTETEDGHQELIDTTASKEEAFRLAKTSLSEEFPVAIVLQETEDGDSKFIKKFELD
jgi:hypothetical protein